MTIIWRYAGLLLLLLAGNLLLAQPIIKEKKSLTYTISSTDSIVRAQKSSTYAPDGTLLSNKDYYYNLSSPGVLLREEAANYDPNKKILTETITRYPAGKEPQTERLETLYLLYAPHEKDSKRIWRRHYDRFGELTKEDTLTYNEQGFLVSNCQYNYMGSTSLLCDEYQYKDTLKKRWLMYSKWNTINAKSEVVEKQTKRRDYRYFYNKNGQLKRIKAKDYSNKILRKLCYNKEGQLQKDHLTVQRQISKPVRDSKGDKTDKTKKYTQKTEHIMCYEEGNLVGILRLVDGQEVKRETFIYNDSILEKEKLLVNGKPSEELFYTYDEKLLVETTKNKYDSKGNLRYTIKTFFNKEGQAIKKEQIARNAVLSITEWTYNTHGHLLSETTYRPTPTRTKKGVNPIERPKEKIVYIYRYH